MSLLEGMELANILGIWTMAVLSAIDGTGRPRWGGKAGKGVTTVSAPVPIRRRKRRRRPRLKPFPCTLPR